MVVSNYTLFSQLLNIIVSSIMRMDMYGQNPIDVQHLDEHEASFAKMYLEAAANGFVKV